MLALAERAARAAAQIIRRGSARRVDHKGAVDLVTEVDLACEETIREVLTRGAPGVPVLGEERGGAEEAATRWIVDPLDGTTNFVHGFPSYAVSVALQDGGELVCGVIVDPVRDRCYRAARGTGAEVDGTPLHVSPCPELSGALVGSGFPYDRRERADEYLRVVRAFLVRAQGFRRAGAAAMDLAWLAEGRLDGFWEFGLKPWDVAAGALLIEEAGGRISDVLGGPLDLARPRVLAANPRLHDQMRAVLAGLDEELPLPR